VDAMPNQAMTMPGRAMEPPAPASSFSLRHLEVFTRLVKSIPENFDFGKLQPIGSCKLNADISSRGIDFDLCGSARRTVMMIAPYARLGKAVAHIG
jgi:hypothetical protein